MTKMLKNTLLFLFLLSFFKPTFCQTLDSLSNQELTDSTFVQPKQSFPKPERFGFITHVPDDLWQITKSPFQKQNLKGLAFVGASTGLLLWQDQNIVNAAQQFGRFIKLNPAVVFDSPVKLGTTRLVKVPQNLNTAIYQLGEGGTSMYIAAGLFLYGKIQHDNRSVQTAGDLTEAFFAMGITTQILKRISGRETPSSATQSGGAWRPFPSFSDFQNNKSNFDSFPSGHLATMMTTVTVLAKDYPEKKWIRPVGYSLIGLTGMAMLNNGVHWAGDYPLAIAIGYITGEIITHRHLKKHRPIALRM
nr:phosphatase PAP2 family protein [uncultured Pedobacter sp.]